MKYFYLTPTYCFLLVVLLMAGNSVQVKAQFINNGIVTNSIEGSPGTNLVLPVSHHFDNYLYPVFPIAARVFVEARVKDISLVTEDIIFNVKLSSLSGGVESNVFTNNQVNFLLAKNRPSAATSREFTDQVNLVESIQLEIQGATPLQANNISLVLRYEIEYNFDVTTILKGSPDSQVKSINKRIVNFNFSNQDGKYFPSYELQVVKLFNQKEGIFHPAMVTTVDFSQALTILIEDDLLPIDAATGKKIMVTSGNFQLRDFKLTIGEGTGIYAWRVRPIGSFVKKGTGGNYSFPEIAVWNNTDNNVQKTFSNIETINSGGYFYITDPDHDKNYIYSRTFSEGNKSSEVISYANSLLQKKQTQTYTESNKSLIVNNSVQDFSGRPSLNTIPVPKENLFGLEGYIPSMVTTTEGVNPAPVLYGAEHFDKDENLKSPGSVIPAQGYEYYHNNSNASVPNSEGYPYSRTLYTNDGTGRVVEQSGVGKQFSIGSRDQGRGRTVRYMYGTASDMELIRVFGDEAPKGDKVVKITTIDQNDVASITYTDISGKTIATCLYDQSDANEYNFQVKDTLNSEIKSDEGMVTTKRLSFVDATRLQFNYKSPESDTWEACGTETTESPCKYTLVVLVHDLQNPENSIKAEKVVIPTGGDILLTKDDFVMLADGVTNYTGDLTFGPGEFIVEKKLLPAKASQEELQAKVLASVKQRVEGYINTLVARIRSIKSEKEYFIFVNDYACKYVTSDCNDDGCTYSSALNCPATPDWNPNYSNGDLKITITKNLQLPDNPNSKILSVFSECCTINVNINYLPQFSCPEREDVDDCIQNPSACPYQESIAATAINDGTTIGGLQKYSMAFNYGFLKYGLEFLESYDVQNPEELLGFDSPVWGIFAGNLGNKASLKLSDNPLRYKLAPNEIDEMVYHMIHDKYIERSPDFRIPGETIEKKYHYECPAVLKAWKGALNVLANANAPGNPIAQENPSSASGNDINLDQIVDEIPLKTLFIFGAKKKKRKIKERIRTDMEANLNSKETFAANKIDIVEIFMEAADYKIARILVGPAIVNEIPTVCVDNNLTTVNEVLSTGQRENNFYNSSDPAAKAAFFRMYSFKYVNYNDRRTDCENSVCFCIPAFNCTPTCPEDLERQERCPYGYSHLMAPFQEKAQFRGCINTEAGENLSDLGNDVEEGPEIPADQLFANIPLKDVDPLEPYLLTWETILQKAEEIQQNCLLTCEQRKEQFLDEVHEMFSRNCYKVVSTQCEAGNNSSIVPVDDVKKIADGIVAQCKTQCFIDVIGVVEKQCTSCADNIQSQKSLEEVLIGIHAEEKLIAMATKMSVELDIVSKCNNANTNNGEDKTKKNPALENTKACDFVTFPNVCPDLYNPTAELNTTFHNIHEKEELFPGLQVLQTGRTQVFNCELLVNKTNPTGPVTLKTSSGADIPNPEHDPRKEGKASGWKKLTIAPATY